MVITFDNVGVAGSSGSTPDTIAQMARNAIAFADALKLESIDLLGYFDRQLRSPGDGPDPPVAGFVRRSRIVRCVA